ncbi:ribonuclease R [Flavobacteriaceae bacterium]|nr:ribonuclease R [Flavobacteriaceae bacterium]
MGKGKNNNRHIEKKILSFFRENPTKEYNYKQIAAVLSIKDTRGRNDLIKILNLNVVNKELVSPSKGKYKLAQTKKQYYQGRLEVTSTGRGFVICEELEQDIAIPKNAINKAFNGDRVEVYCYKRKSNGSLEGEVVNIVERSKTDFVGVLQIEKSYAFVLTRNARMYTDFFIDKKQLTDEYKDGDKVLVRFSDWPKRAESPYGTLIENFGPPGETATEMHAILSDYGLPLHFPEEVEAAAAVIDQSITKEEIKKRRDFRSVLTFTIDPKTAKDFDDALSFQQLGEDLFEVGIHIADVSHYVQPNSLLDEEALARATSVYLVDRVVPMLPEVLSNGVCSLRPHEEKYTFSAVFQINSKAELINEWFGKTVIYSDHRFAYEEAQDIISSGSALVSEEHSLRGASYKVDQPTFEAIITLDKIAKNLRKKRMKNGAISFDRVEVAFNLKEDNTPESVFFKTSKDANKLIEEFMLLANKQVARFAGKREKPLPMVYRVHDEPDPDKLNNLQMIVAGFGYKLNLKTKSINQSINSLLLETQGKQEQNMIDTLTIRCMSKAEYTTHNIGHYGLAFDFYSHFTSPIRRYPDVMVHRLLEQHLNKEKTAPIETIEEACSHSSQRELLATKAERDSIKFMQIKFMENHIGQVFEGVISGVTDRGLYVEIIENKCEGMVRIKDVPGDYYFYDEKNHSLVGERTNKIYQLGDLISVEVAKADLIKRHLDFTFATTEE